MVLSDVDIKKNLENGRIKVTPEPNFEEQLGPCSLDFHLANNFRIFEHSRHPYIDPMDGKASTDYMTEIEIPDGEAFIMRPGEFALAYTVEKLSLADDLLARLEGRSSLGRLGIIVHSTAARFDPGFEGQPVMELGNLGVMPVALYPGMRICSFTFEQLSSSAETSYSKKKGAKYAGQAGPTASKLSDEMHR